jgi:hypothetical protein
MGHGHLFSKNVAKYGGAGGVDFNGFPPLYLPVLRTLSILLFSKIVTECGGVTEGQNDSLGFVSYWEIRG